MKLVALICVFALHVNTHAMQKVTPKQIEEYKIELATLKNEFRNTCKEGASEPMLEKAKQLEAFFAVKNKQLMQASLEKKHFNRNAMLWGAGALSLAVIAGFNFGGELFMYGLSFGQHRVSFIIPQFFAFTSAFGLLKTVQYGIKSYKVSEQNAFDREKLWLIKEVTKHKGITKPSPLDIKLTQVLSPEEEKNNKD